MACDIRKINGAKGYAGWYVSTDGSSTWFDSPTWRDCGNGPEPTSDLIHGPFESLFAAWKWTQDYEKDAKDAEQKEITQ